jgi:acetylglutamate kinase
LELLPAELILARMQIAASLKAEKLILMTDVPGVLRDKDDTSTKFTALDIRQVRELVADGIIAGGMIPKCVCFLHSSPAFPPTFICGSEHHSLLWRWTVQGCAVMLLYTDFSCCCQGGVLHTVLGPGSACNPHH